jgi:hypothetical protein
MVQVTVALVEVVTTALVRTTPVAMEVELGTPMELVLVTMAVVLKHHGIPVRRPAAAAAGKVQMPPEFLLLRLDFQSSLVLWVCSLRAILDFISPADDGIGELSCGISLWRDMVQFADV